MALTGPGSFGRETAYFGPATKMALIKFQLTNGVIENETASGAGILGPRTRARMNELASSQTVSFIGIGAQAKLQLLQSLMTQLVQLLEQLRQLRGY